MPRGFTQGIDGSSQNPPTNFELFLWASVADSAHALRDARDRLMRHNQFLVTGLYRKAANYLYRGMAGFPRKRRLHN
jgi:hypothetical protein